MAKHQLVALRRRRPEDVLSPATSAGVCIVAARLTLEHTSSLLRSLGFASHPLRWFALFTLSRTLSDV
jgi:hypothetical protein